MTEQTVPRVARDIPAEAISAAAFAMTLLENRPAPELPSMDDMAAVALYASMPILREWLMQEILAELEPRLTEATLQRMKDMGLVAAVEQGGEKDA